MRALLSAAFISWRLLRSLFQQDRVHHPRLLHRLCFLWLYPCCQWCSWGSCIVAHPLTSRSQALSPLTPWFLGFLSQPTNSHAQRIRLHIRLIKCSATRSNRKPLKILILLKILKETKLSKSLTEWSLEMNDGVVILEHVDLIDVRKWLNSYTEN